MQSKLFSFFKPSTASKPPAFGAPPKPGAVKVEQAATPKADPKAEKAQATEKTPKPDAVAPKPVKAALTSASSSSSTSRVSFDGKSFKTPLVGKKIQVRNYQQARFR